MLIVADTHIHVYPAYATEQLWTRAARNLDRLAPGKTRSAVCRCLCLAEPQNGRAWETLPRLPLRKGFAWRFVPAEEAGAGRLVHPEEGELWIFSGRQIVTAERIEILALTLDGSVENGLPADQTIEQIRRQHAIPVLSWSPGKWMGKRGRCVADLLERIPPEHLCIGDVLLRPRGTPEPARMRKARQKGFRILAGSDPLPFPGEEEQAGRYATRLETAFDPRQPVPSLRAALLDRSVRLECAGQRNNLIEAARRMARHYSGRRARPSSSPLR